MSTVKSAAEASRSIAWRSCRASPIAFVHAGDGELGEAAITKDVDCDVVVWDVGEISRQRREHRPAFGQERVGRSFRRCTLPAATGDELVEEESHGG
jgi:hypothetical protein